MLYPISNRYLIFEMLRVFAVCIILIGVVTAFKYVKPEYAFLFRLLCVFAVFVPLIAELERIMESLNIFADYAGINSEYLSVALRIAAVTIGSQLTSEICMDAQERAAAFAVELAGRAAVIIISLPIIKVIFEFTVKVFD